MAKSIRSKWKRKCRAIKRERYAVKELARLKKTLGIKEDKPATDVSEVINDQVIFLDASEVKSKSKKEQAVETEDAEMSSDDEKVEVPNETGEKRVFSTKTLKDQNGQYPVWLSKRKIAKMTKTADTKTKKRTKRRRR